MAFIRTVPVESADATVAEIYAGDEKSWGYVPNFTKTFAHRPDVYRAWQRLNASIKSSMDLRRYELATVAAAGALRSSYCTLAHGRMLAEQVMGSEGVIQFLTDRESAPLDAAERAVVAFAEKVALAADQVTQGDVDELRAHGLSDEEIFDVTLAAGARCFFSKVLDATGTEPDAAFQNLEPGLREALTVGRAIEAKPQEKPS
ncbi:carboxymuconolactone decarboxylase family protein [Streptomyces prunicolor]|uniref:carboxymuconolactone decarboxylase family protein n=1 Tax=Streptomyces prunicolor TaxID=67348 RepID=UPI00343E4A62